MEQTRKHFTHDFLLATVRKHISKAFKGEEHLPKGQFSHTDCLMSALAVFTFKCPSLLQFEEKHRAHDGLCQNIKRLFGLDDIPCDTQMRSRLDPLSPTVLRPAFTRLFAMLQRSKILEQFRFLGKYHLISLDGTGYFSSDSVHCKNCCVKEHRGGTVTYYHQVLTAALVHPDQKVAFPLTPEPIMKSDGQEKNDCERNAAKRWLADFRREHPHLPTVLVADGLFANGPFLKLLEAHDMHYIIVCQESDHTFLTDWVKQAEAPELKTLTRALGHKSQSFQWMENVPLNDSQKDLRVGVLRL